MTVYKRGRVYWFKLQFEGKLYRRSTEHTNHQKAQTAAAAFRTALANRNFGIIERKPVPLFKDSMAAFLSWSEQEHIEHPSTFRRYVVSSKPLLRFFTAALDQITPADIEAYKTHRASQKVRNTKRRLKPATINRELACMKAMYNHTLKDRHDFRNPVEQIQFLAEHNEQMRILTFAEQRKYLDAAGPVLKDVATLILELGLRPDECYKIRKENVHLDQHFLFNPYSKTKASRRRVPLTLTALAVLKRRIEAAEGSYLFPHKNDPERPVVKVNNAHDAALKASKLKYFRLYDCRHTWATRAAEAGMDITTLAALLGHSKLVMVMRYVHIQEAHRVESMRRLEVFNAAKEIAEAEKTAGTKTGTILDDPAKLSVEENDDNSSRIN